jgi:NAD+ diphosphatase
VVDENENYALIKQNRYNLAPDKYVAVAAYIGHGETLEEAVKREVFEEIGLVAESVRYLGSYFLGQRDQLMAAFVTRVKHGGFKLSDEVDDGKWFTGDDVESAVSSEGIISKMIKSYKNSE